ncbi:phosphate ABC transporter substrate-binding protein PstS [Streptomyces avicenniae]|uniref:phosphate ABC transporter substrate-binding protein PstS n=1 Tax=Streptomyces avicenniae TaxID=500153 RepID=UPI00069C903E|nr:phosphate ABC transporter substrate-binding protein PstS [Streptomyces avicenniae]
MRNWRARTAAIAVVSALALVTACSSENEDEGSGGSSGGTSGGDSGSPASELSGSLAGAGASSQDAAQQAWMAGFQDANPDVTVTYDPAGSGAGREQFIAGGVAFAGSDAYLDEEELAAANERCGGEVVELPIYVSPIAVIFNLPGVESLNLSAETIAGIFNQQITTWNDDAIAADNPEVELPDTAITPVNRADDSGTTENFTDYLAAVAPDAWPHEASDVWPVEGGEAAQGTSGVVQAVTSGEGTIGYADASQASGLGTVHVGVGDQFTEYSPEAAAAVLEVSERAEGRGEHDFAFDLARETTEAGTYPIVLVSYGLACAAYDDAATADLVQGYFNYILSPEGQQAAADTAGSAPLSADLSQQFQAAVDAIGSAA